MEKKMIDKMVDRFLCWELPSTFAPDGGISFDRSGHKYEPLGTNLFTAEQAKQMFLHCLGTDCCPQCDEGGMDTEEGILGCGNCGYSLESESTCQFEQWAHVRGMCLDSDFFSDAENNYIDPDTRFAYEIWMASRTKA